MCGDATKDKDVEKLMGGKKANLILTDPPYGVSFQSSDGLSIQNDSIKGEEFYQFLLSAFQNMASHLENGGAAYVSMQIPKDSTSVRPSSMQASTWQAAVSG